MVDPCRSSADDSGGGGGSGGAKRRSSSSRPPSSGSPTKRSKAEVTAKGDAETDKPEEEAPVAAAVAKEAGTSSRSAVAAGKKPAPLNVQNTLPPTATGLQKVEPQKPKPWARLISQDNQIPHVLISAYEFSVGRSETCHISLGDDHNASRVLCKLWRLEQPSGCQLQVTGKKGLVELNGSKISKGGTGFLMEGDEVAFCKHAFIFEPFNGVPISASATSPPSCSQIFKVGLKQAILGPDALQFTLEDFPYYLSPNTKSVLLSAAFIHMGKKFIRIEKKLTESLPGISSLNQRILLSGPSGSEIYQETLIKALAKKFGARLLIVDSLLLPVNELNPDSSGDQEVEALGMGELIEVIWEESKSTTLIILVKDMEKTLTGRIESHASLGKELPPGVLIIGSHTEKDSPKDKSRPTGLSLPGLSSANQAIADMLSGSSGSILQAGNKDATNSMKHLNNIFPNKISIELPKDEAQLSELNKQLRIDAESFKAKANASNIHETTEEKPKVETKDEDHSSEKSQRAWRSVSSESVRACFATLGAAGERLQACSAILGGYHVPLTDISEFLRRVATYAPTSTLVGDTSSALSRIARACGEVGTFLGHVSVTVQGATGMSQMLGAGFRSVARLYVSETEPKLEPGPEPEPTSQPTKIIINTLEEVDDAIKWTAGRVVAAVQVDVGPDITPSMAVNIYNEFRTRGSNALALISGGQNMMAKRAMHFTDRSV